MNSQRKQQPVAVCTQCGAFGYTVRYIGERCGKPNGGRRCMGVRGRATEGANWKECPKCGATGRQDGKECSMCLGSGWLYVHATAREAVFGPSV
jgi:hypothetical protein